MELFSQQKNQAVTLIKRGFEGGERVYQIPL
jgi:hypothetical protein